MIGGDKAARAREAVEVLATDCKLSYAALIVSSVALGFELFR
jgi:hypothetical protein